MEIMLQEDKFLQETHWEKKIQITFPIRISRQLHQGKENEKWPDSTQTFHTKERYSDLGFSDYKMHSVGGKSEDSLLKIVVFLQKILILKKLPSFLH